MNKRVTYLFGAGASANALPVVSQMPARMSEYLRVLSEDWKEELSKSISDFDKVIDDFKNVLNEANKHASVDTYAKKLFLKEGVYSSKLITLKFFLSGYFIFEQRGAKYERKGPMVVNDYGTGAISARADLEKAIGEKVDYRYDVFFATLLEKNLMLPSNINILSWNYDYQFELAYNDFGDGNLQNIQKKLSTVFGKGLDEVWAKENSQIVKLNGSALELRQIEPTEKTKLIFNNFDDSQDLNFFIDFFKLFQNTTNSETRKFSIPFLNFAWELNSNKFSKNNIERAKIIMRQTEILVVIGYSFPNFNREIDRMLLTKGEKLEKIYFQAPKEYIDGLIQRLKGISSNKIEVEPYKDINQFCIPYEL